MDCPYNMVCVSEQFCLKCRRCTPEGFSNYVAGGNKWKTYQEEGRATQRINRKKGSSPYSPKYIGAKK